MSKTNPIKLEKNSSGAKSNHDQAWPNKMWHIVREDILSKRVNDTIDGATLRYEKALADVRARFPDTIDKVKNNVTPLIHSFNSKKQTLTKNYKKKFKSA